MLIDIGTDSSSLLKQDLLPLKYKAILSLTQQVFIFF